MNRLSPDQMIELLLRSPVRGSGRDSFDASEWTQMVRCAAGSDAVKATCRPSGDTTKEPTNVVWGGAAISNRIG
jgi:hypothetical protein